MPKANPLPSQDELLAALDYNPETGHLCWRSRPDLSPKVSARMVGKRIVARAKSGHVQIGYKGKVLYAHRVIFKMMTGLDPLEVDHVNCDPSDNRWVNLREADRSDNNANRGLNKNNTSGFKGVYRHACGRWAARITVNLAEHHLGLFDSAEEAHGAYAAAAEKSFGAFARVA